MLNSGVLTEVDPNVLNGQIIGSMMVEMFMLMPS